MNPDAQSAGVTLVIGLGKTGMSCIRHLATLGVELVALDTREAPPALAQVREEYPDLRLGLGAMDTKWLRGVERIVASPGVSLDEPLLREAVAREIEVIGDIELFARVVQAPVIAVTGTNGKSTVTSMVGAMANKAGIVAGVGGNLGVPALDLLDAADTELFVLELSSFQLERTYSLQPLAAVVLNLTPDHMDRYASLESYAAAKARIYQDAAVQVVNADDVHAARLADPSRPVVTFGLGNPGPGDFGVRVSGGEAWLARGEQLLMPVSKLRLRTKFFVTDALAALALGGAAGMPMAAMCDALREFGGLPHRMEWVGEKDGVSWYNDSKGTNVGATVAAIEGMLGPIVLIAGGDGKGADFSALRPAFQGKVHTVVVLGKDGARLGAAVADIAHVIPAGDMPEAVRLAAGAATGGDSVVLSPACASLDMYRNYEQRGDVFRSAVGELLS